MRNRGDDGTIILEPKFMYVVVVSIVIFTTMDYVNRVASIPEMILESVEVLMAELIKISW
ncbi:MAG: hypothetical protein ACI901_001239 [Octadecabacter sp.]|jgi:hypothetical protein